MLRDAIVSGRLQPGQHLKENEIAEQMSVSRSPVREAFRQLEQEGLIVSVPNQGSFVRAFDEKDIREIFALRSALENLACEIVLGEEKIQSSDLEKLEAYIEAQRKAIDAQAFDELTKLDMDFHEFICAKAESGRLLKMWRSLRGQIQILFYQRFYALEQVPATVDTDHVAILAALRKGDIDTITQLNREINHRVAEDCIEVLRSISNE